jgi:predicted Zn finger-like uncharacterized protein
LLIVITHQVVPATAKEGAQFSHNYFKEEALSFVKILYISPWISIVLTQIVLLTQCPHCQTSFRVSSSQLQAANGLVRCGSCLGIFSASANEIRVKSDAAEPIPTHDDITSPTKPTASDWHDPEDIDIPLGDMQLDPESDDDIDPTAILATTGTPVAPPAQETEATIKITAEFDDLERFEKELESTQRRETPDTREITETSLEEDTAIAHSFNQNEKKVLRSHLSALRDYDGLSPLTDSDLHHLDEVPITFVRTKAGPHRFTRTALLTLNTLLLLALPAQWLYQHRNELHTHPRFAFLAPIVCKLTSCQSATTAPKASQMYSQQLLVRTHPRYENALEVSFIFHNDATTPQQFPDLELAFSTVDNKPVANRLFEPIDYLPPELQQLVDMPAKTSIQVALELQDPGKEAVNYTLKIHDHPP